jgi:hypothetical protein
MLLIKQAGLFPSTTLRMNLPGLFLYLQEGVWENLEKRNKAGAFMLAP